MITSNLVLGITGNIASGKTLVAEIFAKKGATRVDADQLARELVAPGSPVLQRLVEEFGPEIKTVDGQLEREKLGEIVFADAAARQQLNQIMHPAIAVQAEQRLRRLRARPGIPLIVYEAPLLFEAGAEGRVDRVLVVRVDPQVQLQRLMKRDGLDVNAAQQRIDAQWSQEKKLERADYIIDNSGSVEEVRQQVERLWPELLTQEVD